MQTTPHVQAIQADLAAAAGLGGEAAAEAAQRLAAALESSLHLRLLDLLNEVAVSLSAQLPDGHVELRLAGRDADLVFVPEQRDEPEQPVAAENAFAARITLRLPESLKASVEAAAEREHVSVNTWLVRAIARSLEPRPPRGSSRNRLQGFARG